MNNSVEIIILFSTDFKRKFEMKVSYENDDESFEYLCKSINMQYEWLFVKLKKNKPIYFIINIKEKNHSRYDLFK